MPENASSFPVGILKAADSNPANESITVGILPASTVSVATQTSEIETPKIFPETQKVATASASFAKESRVDPNPISSPTKSEIPPAFLSSTASDSKPTGLESLEDN